MSTNGELQCPICKCNFRERQSTKNDDATKCKSCQKLYPNGIDKNQKEEVTKLFLGRDEVQELIDSAIHTLKDEMLCIMSSNSVSDTDKPSSGETVEDDLELEEVEDEKS